MRILIGSVVAAVLIGFTALGTIPRADGQDKKTEEALKGWSWDFSAEKADLVPHGRNPYFILEPGFFLILENASEQLTITVLDEKKTVDGVECAVVQELEKKDGKVIEDSKNYFAISKRTNNVYYFGEDVGGAWLSGEKGAKFGMMMPGLPLLKARYYQEIAPGVAMDRAEIVSVNETVVTPAGTFKNCLKTEESSGLKEGGKEFKYYAPGIGVIEEGGMKLVKYGNNKKPK